MYVRLVVPVNGDPKAVLEVERPVVPVFTVKEASGPTVTESVVVCAPAVPNIVSNAAPKTIRFRFTSCFSF
jgi:hypothetical protein